MLEDGIADLQVAGEEPSIADVDAYLDVWLFIVTASSIFDDCNFVVRTRFYFETHRSVETLSIV